MFRPFRHVACAAIAALATPTLAQAADADGELLLNLRLRYEAVDQSGLNNAEALTLRTRLGYETPAWRGFKALAEIENITALVNDYSDGSSSTGQAVVADPESTELNRAQISWAGPHAKAVVGRQRLILGDARFVGNVGFRQNEQTFDAVQVGVQPTEALSFTYAYIDRVHRIFGDDHPNGEWDADTHLAQLDWKSPFGQLTTYGYLMAFENAASQSNSTFGVRLASTRPIGEDLSADYRVEYAGQSGYRNGPEGVHLDYLALSGGLKGANAWGGLSLERLNGDGTYGFVTPLATGHAFQGWADVFLATPADGVRDINLKAGTKLDVGGKPVRLEAAVHDFTDADGGADFGKELDLLAALPLTKHLTTAVKAAIFDGDHPSYADRTKVWVTLELKH